MTLNDLIIKMKETADSQVGVGSFLFNDLSHIDSGNEQDYPLIFVQPPAGSIPKIDEPEEIFNFEMWVFDLYLENDSLELAAKWAAVNTIGKHFLKQLRTAELPDVKIQDPITVDRGHMMHNDNLIGVKYTFTATIFTNCTVGDFTDPC